MTHDSGAHAYRLPDDRHLVASPDAGESHRAAPRRPARADAPQRTSVLLIEDNATLRYALGIVLEDAEFELTSACSARTARLVAHERAAKNGAAGVDLILCDLNLPDGRGEDLVRELIPLLAPRAVLLLSGMSMPPGAHALLASRDPRVGFLQKPFEADELLATARAMLA